jgi:hypothetical protein
VTVVIYCTDMRTVSLEPVWPQTVPLEKFFAEKWSVAELSKRKATQPMLFYWKNFNVFVFMSKTHLFDKFFTQCLIKMFSKKWLRHQCFVMRKLQCHLFRSLRINYFPYFDTILLKKKNSDKHLIFYFKTELWKNTRKKKRMGTKWTIIWIKWWNQRYLIHIRTWK